MSELNLPKIPVSVLDSLPAGIIILRQDMSVAFWNKCIESWTNIKRELILEKPFTLFFPEFNKRKYLDRITFTFENGLPVIFSPQLHGHLLLSKLPDGTLRSLRIVVTRLWYGESDAQALFTVNDVTEQVIGQQALECAYEKLSNENELRINAEKNLQQALVSLEREIKRRTNELEDTNKQLKDEIQRHFQTELALKESREQIRLLLDSTGEAIYGLDTEGCCTFVNNSCLKLLGYNDANQLIGKKMHDSIHYKHSNNTPYPEAECKIHQAFLHGKRTHIDNEVFWKSDGSCFPVEYMSNPIYKDNTIIGSVVAFNDISDRKQKEGEIIKLSQVVEQSSSSIVITDTEGNIEYVNKRFTELTGYTMEDVQGKTPRILKSEKTPPETYKNLWETITAGKTWQGEFFNKKKNGGLYRERVNISPIKNAAGEITRFVSVKDDITEIKALEEEQKKLKEQLYHSQKMESIGRLAGGVAHDFNNMLMGIIGYANLAELEINAHESPASAYIRKILESADKAAKLTQSLLAFSRKQPVALEPEILNEIVEKVKHLLIALSGETTLITTELTDCDVVVMADCDKLEQVIVNLATNAVDAMPEGGRLCINTAVIDADETFTFKHGLDKKGKYAVLSVSDTGTGMDEETKKKVFEPFFTTKERGKGTGIGLSIAYGIIKQHNGNIDVVSEPGSGTTVNVYLPITEKRPKKAIIDAQEIMYAAGSEKPKTILVAEDEYAVREIMEKLLENKGYKVISAVDGEDAVNKFEGHKGCIDMLLFDVMMPGMNGRDAYNRIKKIKPDIKILFMSGYSENILTNKDLLDGRVYFLQKPITPDKLFHKVSEILSI